LIPVYESAIIKANFPDKYKNQVNKIVLITEELSIKILTNHNGKYKFDLNETQSYLDNDIDSLDISTSLKSYFEFIRSYDSFLFWFYLTTRDNANEYYINSDIIWYGERDNQILSSYLNFARVLSDSYLLNLLLMSVSRIRTINGVKNTLTIPLDELVSNLLTFSSRRKTNINPVEHHHLGSICVTRSTEKNFNISDDESLTYFFKHPSGKNLHSINSLLLWHRTDKLTSIEKYAKTNLRRVGSSSSIAPGGWKHYEIPRYDDDGKSLTIFSPKETYSHWQENRFVKFGHYKYGNKHDLFGFDIRSAFDFSHLENSKLTKNIIGLICLYIGIKPSDIVEPLARLTYEEFYLANKVDKIFRANYLVFPFHFNSNYIISFIKKLIKPNLYHKFIGLISYTKISNNTTFSISFLNKEHLEEKIKASKNKNILVFDDAVIGGNILRDITNLLKDIGAKSIKYFCLLDRRRLNKSSSDYDNYDFAWRFDIPRIGQKESCIICNSLREIKSYSNSLISTISKTRIKDWTNNWSAIEPSDNNLNHGINSTPIRISKSKRKFSLKELTNGKFEQKGGPENLLTIYNSLGLSIYLLELLSISKRDDFSAYLIQNEKHLSNEVKIEVSCSTLILFGNSINPSTKLKLVSILLQSLIELEGINNYSSLACLVLLNFINEVDLKNLVELISLPQGVHRIKSLNLDAIILLALFYLKEQHRFQFLVEIKEVNELIDSRGRKPYQDFHYQLFNNFGSTHNTALQAIITEDYSRRNTIQRASLCIDKVNNILNNFDFHQFNCNRTAEDLSILYYNIKTLTTEINEEINDYANLAIKILPNTQKLRKGILEKIKHLFALYLEIHSFLFMDIETEQSEFKFFEELQDLINNNYPNKVTISNSISKPDYSSQITKWFYWDALLKRQVLFILNNHKHSEKKISDPYYKQNDVESDMWVNIKGSDKTISLLFYNYTNKGVEEIEREYFNKIKQERIHLEELGGKIDFTLENNILETELIIPYLK